MSSWLLLISIGKPVRVLLYSHGLLIRNIVGFSKSRNVFLRACRRSRPGRGHERLRVHRLAALLPEATHSARVHGGSPVQRARGLFTAGAPAARGARRGRAALGRAARAAQRVPARGSRKGPPTHAARALGRAVRLGAHANARRRHPVRELQL